MPPRISSFAERALPFSIIAAELLPAGIMISSGAWSSGMMRGSASPGWWFCFQGSLLQHVLLLTGDLVSKVRFRYQSPAIFLERLLALNALFWLVLLGLWAGKMIRGGPFLSSPHPLK